MHLYSEIYKYGTYGKSLIQKEIYSYIQKYRKSHNTAMGKVSNKKKYLCIFRKGIYIQKCLKSRSVSKGKVSYKKI